jgi:hypothetical protein
MRLKLALSGSFLALSLGMAQAQTPQRTGPLEIQNALKEIASNGAAAQLAAQTNLGLGTLNTAAGLDARNPIYAGGAKCDGTTDDTAALQAAIVAAQTVPRRTLIVPAGTCEHTGLQITGPITMAGQGTDGALLRLKAGSTVPNIYINVPSGVVPNGLTKDVTIRDLTLTADSSTDVPGQGVAHGIGFSPAAGSTSDVRVVLNHIKITGMPGDGMSAVTFHGWVDATQVFIIYNAGRGYFANSVTDGRWVGGEIAGSGSDGLVLAGTASMVFQGVNFYVNGGHDVKVFQSLRTVIQDCTIDMTSQDGIWVSNTAAQRLDVIGCNLGRSSTSANATYSDLYLDAGNAGDIYLTADNFSAPASSPNANKPLNNIQFTAGQTGHVIVNGTNFDAGPVTLAAVTNAPGSILTPIINDLSVVRNATVGGTLGVTGTTALGALTTLTSANQFDGFAVSNGTNTVAKLFGQTATNDQGTLDLSVAGVSHARLLANGPSYTDANMSIGTKVAAPSGGLLVTGHIQGNGTGTTVSSGAPDCAAAPSIVGNDNAGRITVGSGTNGGKCTVGFNASWTNPPVCQVANETSGARPVFPTSSTTNLIITSATALAAGDKLTYACQGYQ